MVHLLINVHICEGIVVIARVILIICQIRNSLNGFITRT